MTLDDLMRAMLKVTSTPAPEVARVKVARDLYESMRDRAVAESSVPYRPTFGAVFGIPLEVDDELAPGEFVIVERGGASA